MKLIRPILISGLMLMALPALAETTVTAELPNKDGAKVEGKCSFKSSLKVTPEQKEKLGSLRDQFILSTADTKAQLKVAHNEMRRLMQAPTVDKQAVLNLENKVNSLRDSLSTARVNMMLASTDIFTPEQRVAFAKFHAMRHFRHHRFGRHEGFRGGEGGEKSVG